MRRVVLVLLSALVAWLPFAAPAQAYSCGNTFNYRGYDFANGVTTAKGVQATVRLPAAGTITGVSSSRGPSAGDVYLINGSDFVQAGWYVGSTGTGLPYTTTPRFWVGEYYPGKAGNEVLRAGQALSWGASYTVTISFSSTSGYYNFYLNGAYKFGTLRGHFAQGNASFNGEIDYACVRMYAQATNGSSPTLQYLTFGSTGSVWHYFSDSRGVATANGVTLVSTSDGSPSATDFSYGGGS